MNPIVSGNNNLTPELPNSSLRTAAHSRGSSVFNNSCLTIVPVNAYVSNASFHVMNMQALNQQRLIGSSQVASTYFNGSNQCQVRQYQQVVYTQNNNNTRVQASKKNTTDRDMAALKMLKKENETTIKNQTQQIVSLKALNLEQNKKLKNQAEQLKKLQNRNDLLVKMLVEKNGMIDDLYKVANNHQSETHSMKNQLEKIKNQISLLEQKNHCSGQRKRKLIPVESSERLCKTNKSQKQSEIKQPTSVNCEEALDEKTLKAVSFLQNLIVGK